MLLLETNVIIIVLSNQKQSVQNIKQKKWYYRQNDLILIETIDITKVFH